MINRNSNRTPLKEVPTGPVSGTMQAFFLILTILLLGSFFMLFITPDLLEIEGNAHALNTFTKTGAQALSRRIIDWVPKDILETHAFADNFPDEPDWSVQFWTPIDIEFDNPYDPVVTL